MAMGKLTAKMEEVLAGLGEIGPRVSRETDFSRFPYTYHHDWVRAMLSPANVSRGDVAQRMSHGLGVDSMEYATNMLGGAFGYLLKYMPQAFIDDLLSENGDRYRATYNKIRELVALAAAWVDEWRKEQTENRPEGGMRS